MDEWIRNNPERWREMLREKAREYRADPSQPYNLHFYECRLAGALRIFDLFRDDEAITIGESLVGSMKPLTSISLFSPPVKSSAYIHVNYGGIMSQDPDAVMKEFATKHGLTDLNKLVEITHFNQMVPIIREVLSRLYQELQMTSVNDSERQRVQETVGKLVPEFSEWLHSFPVLTDLYASVGLDALSAAGLIVVLGKIKGTEPPPSIYISLGIWLERRKKNESASNPAKA